MHVVTEGELKKLIAPMHPISTAAGELINLTDKLGSYAEIYRKQSSVRSVVDFLATHAARIEYRLFKRTPIAEPGMDDVQWSRDHELQKLLAWPNGYRAATQFWRDVWLDFLIYDHMALVKIRNEEGVGRPFQLVRIPVMWFTVQGDNYWRPDGILIMGNRAQHEIPIDDVVYVHGYNPVDPRTGISPMETLRTILEEEFASQEWRRRFWEGGAQPSLIISRPHEAPDWEDDDRDRFIESLRAAMNKGRPLLLEEGMTSDPTKAFDPGTAQYVEARQLTREEVVRTYGLHPGLFDPNRSNFAAIAQYREMLYSEALGPLLARMADELVLQLLTDWEPDPVGAGFTLEPQIEHRIHGSMLAQVRAIKEATGSPIMTRAEGREFLGLRSLEDDPTVDDLILPRSAVISGKLDNRPDQPATRETGNEGDTGATENQGVPATAAATWEIEASDALRKFFTRQKSSALSRLGAGKEFDRARWDRELTEELFKIAANIYDETMRPINEVEWYDAARETAEAVNTSIEGKLAAGLNDDAFAHDLVTEPLASRWVDEVTEAI